MVVEVFTLDLHLSSLQISFVVTTVNCISDICSVNSLLALWVAWLLGVLCVLSVPHEEGVHLCTLVAVDVPIPTSISGATADLCHLMFFFLFVKILPSFCSEWNINTSLCIPRLTPPMVRSDTAPRLVAASFL